MEEALDLNNLLALELLIWLGIDPPTQQQIDLIEVIIGNSSIKNYLPTNHSLSNQQKRCLYWLAHGLTENVVSDIMQIDKQIVSHCRTLLCQKLNPDTFHQDSLEAQESSLNPHSMCVY